MERFEMWLHVDNHWLNMTRALVIDDDTTSTPQAISVVFPGEVKRTLTGESRHQVLAWLGQQAQLAQGGVVNVRMPYIAGGHPPTSVVGTTWISSQDSQGER